jgi:KDO2-lipid IV(A) lauroyltransferase
MIEYYFYRTVAFMSRLLPQRLAYWVGLRISDQFYRHNHAGRAAVISNLRRVYAARGIVPAEDALQGLARKMFQYFGKYLVDFFRFARLSPEDVRKRVSLEHWEYLEQALQRGRGALIVTAHIGNWEMGGAVLIALGHRMNALVLPQRLEKLSRMFQRQRELRGIRIIPVGQSGFSIIRCLRRGEIVAVLGDRDFTAKDDRVMFFGQPARIPRGPAWLAVRTGTPVVPAFLLRQVDDTFLLRVYPPIYPEEAGSEEALRDRVCRILEKEIGEQPFQWFIFDDFWAAGASPAGPLPAGHDRVGA